MISYTSLVHPSTIQKIDAAMREAVMWSNVCDSGAFAVYSSNRKGVGGLFVRHCRKNGFSFFTSESVDITRQVKKALRNSIKKA